MADLALSSCLVCSTNSATVSELKGKNMFDTIAQVLAYKFAGNHAADDAAFVAIHSFVARSSTSRADKLAAENHAIVNGMGLEPLTDDELDEHLAELEV